MFTYPHSTIPEYVRGLYLLYLMGLTPPAISAIFHSIDMSVDPKNYELAYLLSSSLSEEGVLTEAGKLTKIIEESQGTIRHVESPYRRELSYPVKKMATAYFGWITFGLNPDRLPELKKKLKAEENLLRHLLVEEEIGTRPQIAFPLPGRSALPRPRAPLRKPKQPAERLDLEALDKKLEEILGK